MKEDAKLSKSLHGSQKKQVLRTWTSPKLGTVKTGGKCAGAYRIHKPSQCEGNAHKFAGTEGDKRKADHTGNAERKLKLANAHGTRIEKVSDHEDDQSEDTYSE
jgi:hypothetical protein